MRSGHPQQPVAPAGSEHRLQDLAIALKAQARALGFEPVGLAALPGDGRIPLRTAALERWLEAGHQAGMAWMNDPRRRQVTSLLPGVRSLLAVGLNYHVATSRAPGSLAVARYGWGRDYHRVINGRLRRLGRWLEEQCPGVGWRACVDSAPLLEPAWAQRPEKARLAQALATLRERAATRGIAIGSQTRDCLDSLAAKLEGRPAGDRCGGL